MSSAIQYGFPVSLPWSEKLVSKLSAPDYRHAYMVQGVKNWIARQVRTLREQRGWSQEDLGRATKKPQSAISRVEDPDYGKLTLQTLFDLAKAYDLPLLVQFVEWSDWLTRMDDASTEALQKESFSANALTDIGSGQVFLNFSEPAINQYENIIYRDYFAVYPADAKNVSLFIAGTVNTTGVTYGHVPAHAVPIDDDGVDEEFEMRIAFPVGQYQISEG